MSHAITLPIEVQFRPNYGEYSKVEDPRRSRPQFHFLFLPRKRNPADVPEDPVDAWRVRDDFLIYQGDTVQSFAQQYGRFSILGDIRRSEEDREGIGDFRRWQDLIASLMTTPPSKWKGLSAKHDPVDVRAVTGFRLPLAVDWRNDAPYGVVKVSTVRDAILATIQIDFLQGARFRHCARPDCSSPPFKLESRHDKKYCSYACAHLEVVRRGRKKKVSKRTKE